MAIAPSLQIRRMLPTGSSRDYSLLYPTLLCVGFFLWLAYGLALGNWAMIVSNVASLTFMPLTIGVAIAFRRGKGGPRPATRRSRRRPRVAARRQRPSRPTSQVSTARHVAPRRAS